MPACAGLLVEATHPSSDGRAAGKRAMSYSGGTRLPSGPQLDHAGRHRTRVYVVLADVMRQLRAKRLQRVGDQHGCEKLAAFGHRAVGAGDELAGIAGIAACEHLSGDIACVLHGLSPV